MYAAGYAASAAWLKGRGTDPAAPSAALAINALAASDGTDALRCLDAAGCPGASLGPAGDAALRILLARWETVLRLGYALARRRSLGAPEIGALLAADPYRAAGHEAYLAWQDEARRGRPRVPGQPAVSQRVVAAAGHARRADPCRGAARVVA